MNADEPRPRKWFAPQDPADEQTFVGRSDVVGPLANTVRIGCSAGLTGGGGMGKTSVLKALERDLARAGARAILVATPPTEKSDAARVARRVVDAVASTGAFANADREWAYSLLGKGMIKEALEWVGNESVSRSDSGRRPIVLLDDCHRMSPGERGILWSALNSIVDRKVIAFVLCGRAPLWDEVDGQNSPCWYLLNPKIPLEPFTRKETKALCERATAGGLSIDSGAVRTLHDELGGYPYGICQVLYRLALAESPVTSASVRNMARHPPIAAEIAARRAAGSSARTTPTHAQPIRLTSPKRIFLLHAPEDRPLADELRAHLSPMKQGGIVAADLDLLPGAEVEHEVRRGIETADVVLALVSADLFAVEACQAHVQFALERSRSGRPRVVPVLARPADWKSSALGKLRALPDDETPIGQSTDRSARDAAWLNVVRGLRELLREWKKV